MSRPTDRASRAALSALALVSLLVGCGRGEDRPGMVTADEDATTSTSISTSTSSWPEPEYMTDSDVGADLASAADVARIRELVGARPVDWETVTEIWHRGPDRIADVPEPTQLVDDAIAGRSATAPAVRRVTVQHGLDLVVAVRVGEELAEAEAALSADGRTDALHDVDQAWVYFRAGRTLATIALPVETALARAQQAAREGARGELAAAAADVEAQLDHFFYQTTLEALRDGADAASFAAARVCYTAISSKVEGVAPAAHEQVTQAIAARDAMAMREALARVPVRQVLAP